MVVLAPLTVLEEALATGDPIPALTRAGTTKTERIGAIRSVQTVGGVQWAEGLIAETERRPQTNRFAGACRLCGAYVGAGEGRWVGGGPRHAAGVCGIGRPPAVAA